MNTLSQTAIDNDKRYCWHPFTQQQDWCAPENNPLMIARGHGCWLWDTEGNKYLDGNSSIWTNIHGHCHPVISQAIKNQLDIIAHSSFLGFGHPLAGELAAKLVSLFPPRTLERVFFSDDGSTAMEVALKLSLQYRIQQKDPAQHKRCHFIAMDNCYHGDTLGAASLGGVSTFFEKFQGVGHLCHHVADLNTLFALPQEHLDTVSALVIEPLVQGVNQIHLWSKGMLSTLRQWTQEHGIHLILDEVMTGFGRTGTLFACMQESITPDFLCCAKGLTGGYTPLAATLCTREIYEGFLGTHEEQKTFYYGHSFTAHPLGCAAALASLRLFEETPLLSALPSKALYARNALQRLADKHPHIYEIRQIGLVIGIDIRQPDGTHFPEKERIGTQICDHARQAGLLTRPILDTIVLMPPLCITETEIDHCITALDYALTTQFS